MPHADLSPVVHMTLLYRHLCGILGLFSSGMQYLQCISTTTVFPWLHLTTFTTTLHLLIVYCTCKLQLRFFKSLSSVVQNKAWWCERGD